MEKFSQYRDKGSGIAPFLPIPTEPAGIYLPVHLFLYTVRLPLLLACSLSYFFLLQWLPIGAAIKRAILWAILGVPGIWWIDLQIDGVRKGSLSQHNARIPQAGSVIASSSASPIDPLYLAAIFDPIFTASYPETRSVERISLFSAVLRAFSRPRVSPPNGAKLYELETLLAENPNRIIVVFPEGTTSNGRGILPLTPSLLSVPAKIKVFPLSLRYTPADVTTPVPHSYFVFLWNLCSHPTHCIRIRIAEAVFNPSSQPTNTAKSTSNYTTNTLDALQMDGGSDEDTLVGDANEAALTEEEQSFLDRIAEALARLGRAKRVGLGVKDKVEFVAMWTKQKR